MELDWFHSFHFLVKSIVLVFPSIDGRRVKTGFVYLPLGWIVFIHQIKPSSWKLTDGKASVIDGIGCDSRLARSDIS